MKRQAQAERTGGGEDSAAHSKLHHVGVKSHPEH